MKIIRMDIIPVEMPLQEHYTVAYQTFDKAENVFVRLETSSGITGYGCAAPEKEVTGETVQSVISNLDSIARERLLHSEPLRISYIMEDLKTKLPDKPGVHAAVDMALHDILGKYTRMPLWKLLGGFRTRILTSITIGILPVTETIEKAEMNVKKGFRALKIKGGLEVENDIERLIKVREKVGDSVELRFDANQGYTIDQALDFIESTRHIKLELIEQPISKAEHSLMERITREAPIPVMADESIVNLRDAFRIARRDLADMINIKLMKVGGIAEALHINSVARAARLEAMIGCMDETAFSIAAGLHFALAKPNVVYADLDGHLDLINDPTAGTVTLKNGYLYPTGLPGIGLDGNL